MLENGTNLSGGEKQRLALARLFVRNPDYLWLLDEPNSSLDTVTEHEVLEEVFKAAAESILVLVSHHLTGLETMDQIIVMDHGQIVAQGTYAELNEAKWLILEMKEVEKEMFMA